MVTATTSIVPMPKPTKIGWPANSCQAWVRGSFSSGDAEARVGGARDALELA
jgi:hypothetical protein